MSSSTPSKSLGAGVGGGPRSTQGATGAGGALPASAAGRAGAGPGAGRLRSDLTRPPSVGSMHRPTAVRAGKDSAGQTATPAGVAGVERLAGATGSAHDVLSAGYAHTNALYGVDDAGASAPARSREYSPGGFGAASGGFGDEAVGLLTTGAAVSAAMQHPTRKLGAPSPFLQTHGDLWSPGDQYDGDDFALHVRAPTKAALGADAAAAGLAARSQAAQAAMSPPAQQQQQQHYQLHQQQQSALLVLPAWLRSRPFSTALHLAGAAAAGLDAEAEGEPAPDLRALPEAVREAALVDDLLFCFMGVPGRCIRPTLVDDGGPNYLRGPALAFAPAAALDERSAEVVRRLLPLPEYAAVVERFAVSRDSPERGMVTEALASEMRALLEKWRLLVVQLERRSLGPGGLSLSELLFQCQAPMASLKLAAEIAAEASSQELTSAGLLNLLHRRLAALGGDAAGSALAERLLAAAAEPYFDILGSWLAEGVLDDPYSEFMVKEDTSIGRHSLGDDQQLTYWAQRYVLRSDPTYSKPDSDAKASAAAVAFDSRGLDVPAFLWPCRDAILTTGKYLNAMRECGAAVPALPLPSGRLRYDASGTYLDAVSAALDSASGALLRLMLGQGQLMGWLRSIKHFFLLDQGDLLVHLLEGAQDELSKPASQVSRPRLRSLLELAARTSSVAADPRLDNLKYTFDARSLTQLVVAALAPATPSEPARPGLVMRNSTAPAWQVLLLDFKVEWPLSLVVSRRQLLQYQVIFKHLFQLKFAERQLNAVWAALQPTRGLLRADQERFRQWHMLCRGLTHVLQEYLRYVTTDVLEPLWLAMEERISRARDIDEVMRCHQAFLLRAADGTLLTQLPILKCVVELQRCAHDLWREASVLTVRAEAAAPAAIAPRPVRGGGSALGRQESSFERELAALRGAARDEHQAAAVAALGCRFQGQLTELAERLGEHYQKLLAGAGPRAAGAAAGGSVNGNAAGSAAVAAVATREELDSLLNLIERIDVGGGDGGSGGSGSSVTAALAGMGLAGV